MAVTLLAQDTEIEFGNNEEDSYYATYGESDPDQNDHLTVEENSDYIFLYTDASTLPHLSEELGVFAKTDIPRGEIICEHRGKIVRPEFLLDNPDAETFTTYLPSDGTEALIVGNEVCAYINDAAHIVDGIDADGKVRTPYSTEYLVAVSAEEEFYALPPTPGFAYNAKFHRTQMGKVFILSTHDIKAGEEIFFSYGVYVLPLLLLLLLLLLLRYCMLCGVLSHTNVACTTIYLKLFYSLLISITLGTTGWST